MKKIQGIVCKKGVENKTKDLREALSANRVLFKITIPMYLHEL